MHKMQAVRNGSIKSIKALSSVAITSQMDSA